MKILISNDDGIFAPGIAALVRVFAEAGHEVAVCAPDSQRSAASHSLTIGKAVSVKEMQLEGAVCAYAIGGTPVDCVKLGLLKLCPDCEAVISGINRGYNVGTDILYSGTVAAAMEGAICGLPALAVSQPHGIEDYAPAAGMAVQVFEHMMKNPPAPYRVLNLNYPACRARGLVSARMQPLHYDELYMPGVNEDGNMTYTLNGVVDPSKAQSEDYVRLCEGYATLTVLRADMTDERATDSFDLKA